MRRNWWIIFSYICAVIAFLVIASYAVLFATGYKYDWQNHAFKKTGFILIETYPKDATVTVAGRHITKMTPVTVKRLLPGNYLVEINKLDYRPWQAVLEVKSGLVTEQRNVLLTLKELTSEKLRSKSVNLLAIAPNGEKLALVFDKEISLFNVSAQSEANIYDPSLVKQRIVKDNSDIANGIIKELGFGPDNKTLLLRIAGKLNDYHLLLDSETGLIKVIAKGRTINNWQWLNSNELTFTQGDTLYLVNGNSAKNEKIATGIIGYSLINGSIYGITQDKFGKHSLIKIDKNTNTKIEIDNLPVAKYYQMARLGNNWLLITKGTTNTPASIWWSELKNNETSWVKLASNITSKVLWDNSHIIYQSGNQVVTTEVDADNQLTTTEIFTAATPLDLVNFGFDTLLYIESGKLKSLDLTGKNNYALADIKNSAEIAVIGPQMSQIIYIDADTRELKTTNLREKSRGLLNFNDLIHSLN